MIIGQCSLSEGIEEGGLYKLDGIDVFLVKYVDCRDEHDDELFVFLTFELPTRHLLGTTRPLGRRQSKKIFRGVILPTLDEFMKQLR